MISEFCLKSAHEEESLTLVSFLAMCSNDQGSKDLALFSLLVPSMGVTGTCAGG